MIIECGDVPDSVLDALLEAAPDLAYPAGLSRESWRQALAAALTAWEHR